VHPSTKLKGQKSEMIKDKKIVLGVTGSISAVETVKLARELVRHGADVYPIMTDEAQKIIHPQALKFASGYEPILKITGDVEHVSFGEEADLFLVAPCTANTISKMANGIGDTPVTNLALTVLSNIPTILAPAMHLSMYENPAVKENIRKLEGMGVEIVPPLVEGPAAKLAAIEEIVARVIRTIGPGDLSGRRVTVMAGPTLEPIDDVRGIINTSSGGTGIELAKNAYMRGADVELWYGVATEKPPTHIPLKNFVTAPDLLRMIEKVESFDVVISCAAISDFIPERKEGKIPSGGELTLKLKPFGKVLDHLLNKSKFVVGFKLEDDKEKAIKKGKELVKKGLDMVIANDTSDLFSEIRRIYIIGPDSTMEVAGTRTEIAKKILDSAREFMGL